MQTTGQGTEALRREPGRALLAALVAASLGLLLATAIGRLGLAGGLAERLVYFLSLGVENGAGAWWSGMLFLGAAVLAYDACLLAGPGELPARRGWLILAVLLALLSLDEVGSLHERLELAGARLDLHALLILAPFAAAAGLAAAVALLELRAAGGAHRRRAAGFLPAFGLIGAVPVLETVTHARVPEESGLYVVLLLVEEGAEIAAALLVLRLCLGAALDGAAGRAGLLLALPQRLRRVHAGLWPLLALAGTLATALLEAPRLGRPADWASAAALFLAALALLRTRADAARPDRLRPARAATILGASVAVLYWPADGSVEIAGTVLGSRMLVAGGLTLLAIGPGLLRGRHGGADPATPFLALFAAVSPLVQPTSWAVHLASQALAFGVLAVIAREDGHPAAARGAGADAVRRRSLGRG